MMVKPNSYTKGDADGDGKLNHLDLDADNDGITDIVEAGGTDVDRDGLEDAFVDADNDGFNDVVDGDPTNALATGTDTAGANTSNATIVTGADTDNDGKPNTYPNGDLDTDGNLNHLDIDADNDGIPDNVEGQPSKGYITPSGQGTGITDVNNNGVDDVYEDIPNNLVGLLTENTDITNDAIPDYLDTDSDNDGILDIAENGVPAHNVLSGGDVDGDGLYDIFDENNDSSISGSTVNDNHNPPSVADLGDVDNDFNTIGDFDYRDTGANGTPMITQVYQFGSERWIEITNISTTNSIPANLIKIQLYKDKTGDQLGVLPDVNFIVPAVLDPGESVLFRNSSNVITNFDNSEPARVITNDALTDIGGANDIITLSAITDKGSYNFRYDAVSGFADKTSYVRIDETLVPNKDYTPSEWVVFVNDIVTDPDYLDPYKLLGDGGPERHPHDPLISEIINSNTDANTRLGLHRINVTTRTGNVWNNGFPDRSRHTVVEENYNHIGSRLSARKLVVNNNSKLAVTDELLVVTNDITLTNSNDEIRLVGTSQLIQTHTGTTKVSGSGKLLVDQNSTVPSLYRYNYMSSPVNTIGANTYSLETVLKDGTTPLDATSSIGTIAKDITFVGGYDGATTDPITLAEHWVYSYSPGSNGRSNWAHKYRGLPLDKGDGYIFKGPGRPQNYTFLGTPNDGNFNTVAPVGANESYLIGNPFPSAMSVKKFIEDNINSTNATLYFWQHVSESTVDEGSAGHNFAGYIGGYATRNISMGVTANDPSANAPFEYTVEVEDADEYNVSITQDQALDVANMNTNTSFVKFSNISRGLDTLRVVYKSMVDKNIKIKIDNADKGNFVFQHTDGSYDEGYVIICIEPGSDVTLTSNDTNDFFVDSVIFKDDGKIVCAPSTGGSQYADSYTAPEPYIAIGQGFFVQGDATDGGPIVFNNSQREFKTEGTGSSVFLRGESAKSDETTGFELPIIKLGMNYQDDQGTNLHRQIGASFHSSNSFAFEKGYDSEMYDTNTTDFYWKFPNDELGYVITGVQEISNDLEVPLEVIMNKNGLITITIDEMKYINNQDVFIKDKLTGETQQINDKSAVYQLEKGTYTDRFVLSFVENSTLGVDDNINEELQKTIAVFMDNANKEMVIQNLDNLEITKVQLFNILGQKVAQWKNLESKPENRLETKNLVNQIYIVNVYTNKGKISKKIVIE
ncbi:T9SS type A sorting domain-containing protein [Polaribacter pectinis]|uniref:T9SS type A sorting domain-containing protein n=1 Tax=Polaribacter pectinis TaxID=2738844 RepID=A0A7G9L712_9FLAO|nr:T9SS type A sorting domain-containing protein [Polaribacter pectinis]QNM84411.1 T9SS type A sorting domain-containing protein [Polaribacter pectinis]